MTVVLNVGAPNTGDEPSSLIADYGRYMTTAELCELLKLSPSTLHRMIGDGRLPRPVAGFGTHINRWRTEDIETWYENAKPRVPPKEVARRNARAAREL